MAGNNINILGDFWCQISLQFKYKYRTCRVVICQPFFATTTLISRLYEAGIFHSALGLPYIQYVEVVVWRTNPYP
jgi:hypothetical protein